MKSTLRIAGLMLLATTCTWAQGKGNGSGKMGGPGKTGTASGLDMSRVQVIEGTVKSANLGFGTQYPTVEVGGAVVRVAPAWYMLAADFELKAGDLVRIQAAPGTTAGGVYWHAIEILNTLTGTRIVLRDAGGVPLWSGAGRSSQPGAAGGGACTPSGAALTVTGRVDSVAAGAGIQMPTVTLRTADGSLIVIRIGPERILLEADFEIRAGQNLTVTYVACQLSGNLIALELQDADGHTITLRDGSCRAIWP